MTLHPPHVELSHSGQNQPEGTDGALTPLDLGWVLHGVGHSVFQPETPAFCFRSANSHTTPAPTIGECWPTEAKSGFPGTMWPWPGKAMVSVHVVSSGHDWSAPLGFALRKPHSLNPLLPASQWPWKQTISLIRKPRFTYSQKTSIAERSAWNSRERRYTGATGLASLPIITSTLYDLGLVT